MPEWSLKYADARGEMHQQVAVANSERELRDRYAQQGFLIYSIKPRGELAGLAKPGKKQKLNLEKFLIFNQQFVTLIRAGLPILKGLDLLAERLDRSEARQARARGSRRGAQRRTALRCFRAAGRVSADLCHIRASGRKDRRARRGAGSLHPISAPVDVGPEEDSALAALSRAC